jgi:nitronate monooxygenase
MGGVAWHGVAAAVSEAGGLGTIGGAESRAHPKYKRRSVQARRPCSPSCSGRAGRTRRTESSRTLPRGAGSGPTAAGRAGSGPANRVGAPLVGRLPPTQERAAAMQRPSQPFLGPQPPTVGGPDNLVDSGPLYAGANVGRIADVRPAAELVPVLAP